jgi:DnaJ-class molecular chaperone
MKTNHLCQTCDGMGGFDASQDCEAYDDWRDCETCGGSGLCACMTCEELALEKSIDVDVDFQKEKKP